MFQDSCQILPVKYIISYIYIYGIYQIEIIMKSLMKTPSKKRRKSSTEILQPIFNRMH